LNDVPKRGTRIPFILSIRRSVLEDMGTDNTGNNRENPIKSHENETAKYIGFAEVVKDRAKKWTLDMSHTTEDNRSSKMTPNHWQQEKQGSREIEW
jgi:hypothetical protein